MAGSVAPVAGTPLREVAPAGRPGWTKSGKAGSPGSAAGGATLQIVDQNVEAVPVSRLVKDHILKGKESPVDFLTNTSRSAEKYTGLKVFGSVSEEDAYYIDYGNCSYMPLVR